MVKRRIVAVILAIILILIMPVTFFVTGFCLPSQFSETYYGELPYMFEKLKTTKGKKIVLIGNSAVAFGVRSDLLQAEFSDYTVVNFGLYGALGTKLMLDLSKVNVAKDDIVVVMPEPYSQSLSLYFSAKDTWRAVESNAEMLSYIAKENRSTMVGAYVNHVQEKFSYYYGNKQPAIEGVYSRNSFVDDNGKDVGYMTYQRDYNVMSGGYDPTLLFTHNENDYGKGFIDYLYDYNEYVKSQGATLYYGFVPVNSLAVESKQGNYAQKQYEYLRAHLNFETLGHPQKYVLDHHWFYDNNVHMNSSGMYVYTDLLAEDLKLKLGITTPNSISIPAMPAIPVKPMEEVDNSDADMFTYEVVTTAVESYVRLTGLTQEGKNRTELTLPTDYNGLVVKEFSADVFKGNTTISKIIIPKNIGTIYDNSFDGAYRLAELVFRHDSILGLNVGSHFLAGADNCLLYVKRGVNLINCAGGWEQYQSRVRYY